MKPIITPWMQATACAILLLAATCQKEQTNDAKTGYEQHWLQTPKNTVAVEMVYDVDNLYLRATGPISPIGLAIYPNNCDSLRTLLTQDPTIVDLDWTITSGRDTVWSAYAIANYSKCLCVVVVDADTTQTTRGNATAADLGAGTNNNSPSLIKYCIQ